MRSDCQPQGWRQEQRGAEVVAPLHPSSACQAVACGPSTALRRPTPVCWPATLCPCSTLCPRSTHLHQHVVVQLHALVGPHLAAASGHCSRAGGGAMGWAGYSGWEVSWVPHAASWHGLSCHSTLSTAATWRHGSTPYCGTQHGRLTLQQPVLANLVQGGRHLDLRHIRGGRMGQRCGQQTKAAAATLGGRASVHSRAEQRTQPWWLQPAASAQQQASTRTAGPRVK